MLEPTKLTRLVETIHERLADHPGGSHNDHFEVFLSGNRREESITLEGVLAMENSRRHRIQRLLITSYSAAEHRAAHEIQVDFAGSPTNPQSNRHAKVIAASVRSDDAGWASRTLSALEEQIERTWQRNLQSILTLIVLLACVLFVLLSQFVSFRGLDLASSLWLRDADFDRLEQLLAPNGTLTEEELREVTTRQFRNIVEARRPKQADQKQRTRQ